MEMLRFIRWLWSTTNIHIKILLAAFLFCVITLVLGLSFGVHGLFAVMILMLVCLFSFLMHTLYKAVGKKYKEYLHYKDIEAQHIIDRLKGAR